MSNVVAAAKRRDWSTVYWLILVTLIGLPLISPLLRWTAVPCTHDGHLHYHRIAALRHLWESGVITTRWMPDLAFGYGYPFFVYREGPPLYLPLIPHLLGLPLAAASNLFYALTILAAGWFMFLWVRDLFGPRSAIVSAVAYMAAPYVLVDALVRGNSPESLALPLLPLILWAGRRWVLFGRAGAFVVAALGLALLSLSHNISAVIFAPTVGVYLLALLLADRGQMGPDQLPQGGGLSSVVRRPFLRLFALLALGLGLAFFYTGGALLEMDQVTLEQSTSTRNNDWRNNFASLGEITRSVEPEDPWLVNPPLSFRLGWSQIALALAGASGLLWIRGRSRRAREQRVHIWLMLLGAAAYLFMALPISRPVWEALPLIDFVQFPWRFVGRAALPVAFLAGVGVYWTDLLRMNHGREAAGDRGSGTNGFAPTANHGPGSVVGRLSPFVPALAVALLVIETLPNLYPRYCEEEPFPTILTVHAYERGTGLVGVDPEGSYFPRTVVERPSGSPLESDYQAGRPPQRFDATALPPAAAVGEIAYDELGVRLTVDTPQAFTARYLSFAFPGWSARVDGEAVPITPEDPSGLITFPIPAGSHQVEVRWGATPLRLALVSFSVLCGVGVVVVAFLSRRRTPRREPREATFEQGNAGIWAALILVAIALAATRAVMDTRLAAQPPGQAPVSAPRTLHGGALALEGYSLSRSSLPSGETADIDMAWRAVAPPGVDYQTEVWLEDGEGRIWSEKGTQRPRLYEDAAPTRQWEAGEWGWDSREVRVLPGTPPGDYDIVVTLFDKATLQPVTLFDPADGRMLGPTAVIGSMTVEMSPEAEPPPAQFAVEADVPGTALRLLGYNQDRAEGAPGDPLLMTFFWSCSEPARCDDVRLSLVDQAGIEARGWDIPAVRDAFSDNDWPEVGYLRGQHLLQLPAALSSGAYRFVLNDVVELGELAVTAPERTFSAPPMTQTLDTPFLLTDGTVLASLVGIANSEAPCSQAPQLTCSIPLVWRAESLFPTGYHVFVHLVDEAGNILAQSDGVPAGWTRPTTGWLPGEYVVDTHTLTAPSDLPPDPLRLRVGLYDPDSGARLSSTYGDYHELSLAP